MITVYANVFFFQTCGKWHIKISMHLDILETVCCSFYAFFFALCQKPGQGHSNFYIQPDIQPNDLCMTTAVCLLCAQSQLTVESG